MTRKSRKSPTKHHVRKHHRGSSAVHDYTRGQGLPAPKLANPVPSLRKTSITNSRIWAKLKTLKHYQRIEEERGNQRMVDYYRVHITALNRFLGRTKSEMKNELLLMGDEISAVRAGEYDTAYLVALESALDTVEKTIGMTYPKPEYNLATGLNQDANIIGYKPKSEKLVWMDPKEFLRLATPAFYDTGVLKNLKEKMKTGKPLDALFFDVDVYTSEVQRHEGRHRAKIAIELGIKKVPVVLYARDGYEWESASKLPSVNALVKQKRG